MRGNFLYYVVICLQVLMLTHISCVSGSSSNGDWNAAPWQAGENSQSLLEQSTYSQRPPTIFSPTGRLHPVERTMEAAKQPNPRGNLVVAVTCQDGLLVFSTMPLSPYLNTTNNTLLITDDDECLSTPIVDLSPGLVGATAGNALDGQVLRTKLQAFAEQTLDDDQEMDGSTIAEVARQLADHLQVPTQRMYTKAGPLLASFGVILGNNQIWRVDPTGQFWKCLAACVGRDADKVEEALFLKLSESNSDFDLETYLTEELTCSKARQLICDTVQDIMWPMATLRALPAEMRSRLPSIPWAAVKLHPAADSSGIPKRSRYQGAFLPPKILTET